MYHKKPVKKHISLLLAFCLVFSGMLFMGAEPAHAASKPAKVKSLSVSSKTSNSISIKWGKAKNAKKYQIAYKKSGGKWYYKKTTGRSYKFSNLASYTSYSFKVRGIRGKSYGKWSSVTSKYTNPSTSSKAYQDALYNLPAITELSVVAIGPASIKLKWSTEADEQIEKADTSTELIAETSEEDAEPDNELDEKSSGEEQMAEESEKERNEVDLEEETKSEEIKEELIEELNEEPEEEEEPEVEEEPEPQKNFSNASYRIYQSTDGKKWSLVASNISGDVREYTVRKLLMGKKYYFKLVAQDSKTFKNYTVVASTADDGGMCKIVDGKTNTIEGLSFKTAMTTRNLIYKENRSYTVKGLMLHSVGAAKENSEYWYNKYNKKGYDDAAVHAFIDGPTGVVWQTMPWDRRAGHAGATANDRYVGIEMCESKYIKYYSSYAERKKHGGKWFSIKDKKKALRSAETTYNSAVNLFAYLCDYYGFDPKGKDVIISHNEWRKKGYSGHYDPEHYWSGLGTGYKMSTFRKDVKKVLENSRTEY